jgi:large conductance mechanosensitive channel
VLEPRSPASSSRDHVLDLALAVVVGVALGTAIRSLVDDVLLDLVAALAGQDDFRALVVHVGDGAVRNGSFLTSLVNLAATVLAVVLVLRPVLAARQRSRQDCPYCLTSIPAAAVACAACTREVLPD